MARCRIVPGIRQLVVVFGFMPWMHAFAEADEKKTLARHVIFIVADDLGYRDLGCYGSDFYETPHLDRLATEGALFRQAYASSPVCSPTRASLLTGKYPVRTGVTDYIEPGGANQPHKWKKPTPLVPAAYHDRLSLDEVTFAEVLQGAGYRTCFAGKWHLGPVGHYPEDQGFHVNHGGIDRGGPYGGKKYFSPYGNPRLPDGPPGEHLPDRLASEVNRFLTAHRDDKVLIYLPFYSVHAPFLCPDDLRKKYEAKRKSRGIDAAWGTEGKSRVRLGQSHPVYAGMVEAMDSAIGKVLDHVESLGTSHQTLVIFTSDNGGLSTAEGHPTSNAPLRAGKGWLYEGGIRVPLVVRWPGVVRRGATIDFPATSPDLCATVLDAAGHTPPADIDGMSLVPLLGGRVLDSDRPLFWHYPHYGNQGGEPGAAVRVGDWKLIEWFHGPRIELFHLNDDPGETADCAAAQPDRVAALRDVLHAWQRETRAVTPTINGAFAPASTPSAHAIRE